MSLPVRHMKTSGRIAPDNALHQPIIRAASAPAPTSGEHYISPTVVAVTIKNPPPAAGAYSDVMYIPQYAPTVFGGDAGYAPATNCGGNFMSAKFQPNNNCYAYGCNITPNSFPQPGRKNGTNLWGLGPISGPIVQAGAELDGLIYVGTKMSDVTGFFAANPKYEARGHFVALMISPMGTDSNWPGDYHWARCDNSTGACNSWSQKDGSDQVTNFDFAGNAITDPSVANWTVNQGPVPAPEASSTSPVAPPAQIQSDNIVNYNFYCFMYVPYKGVDIL